MEKQRVFIISYRLQAMGYFSLFWCLSQNTLPYLQLLLLGINTNYFYS